jgi:serine/threonine protein kinase
MTSDNENQGKPEKYAIPDLASLHYLSKGNHELAEKAARQVLEENPAANKLGLGVAHYVLGEINRAQGRQEEADSEFGKVLEIDPGFKRIQLYASMAGFKLDMSPELANQDPSEHRKNPEAWSVPGWTLEKYIARGAYGHTFVAVNKDGQRKVIKIYDLRPDAEDDLRRFYGLPKNPSKEQFLSSLEKAIDKEAMKEFGKLLTAEERRRVMLPEDVIMKIKSDDGIVTHATVSEWMEQTLEDEIKEGKYRNPRKYLPLFRSIIEAAAIVHKKRDGKRRVHNDIKPSNIGIDWEGRVRLFDFGIATTMCSHYLEANYPNLGSLEMRDPDLNPDGPKPSPRSDVWQLGCLMSNILLRENPFHDTSRHFKARTSPFDYKPRPKKGKPERKGFEESLPAMIREDIPRIMEHFSSMGIPAYLREIIKRCFALEGDEGTERYSNAEKLLADFDRKSRAIYKEYDLSKPSMDECMSELAQEHEAGPILIHEGRLNGVYVDPVIFEKMRDPRMRMTVKRYRLWVGKRGNGRLELAVSKSQIEGGINLVAAAEGSPKAHADLLEFAEFYSVAESFNKIVSNINKIEDFDERSSEERQLILDEMVALSTKRRDLVMRVGYREGRFTDEVIDKAEHIMERSKDFGLSVYLGNKGGEITKPTDRILLLMLAMEGGYLYHEKGPVYVIVKSNSIPQAEDAAEKLLEEALKTAPKKIPKCPPPPLSIWSRAWDEISWQLWGKWEHKWMVRSLTRKMNRQSQSKK